MEGQHLWGYDGKIDRNISSMLAKGMDLILIAFGFTSKSKFVVLPYSDMSNPETASWKYEGEFKSLYMYVETFITNKKPLKTEIYTRAK